jgi:glycine oxidase
MSLRIGIAGAGLVGRLTALTCLARGYEVTLFDKDESLGHNSCGWVAAGMLAPFTELESSELLVCQLGVAGLNLWPRILNGLISDVAFEQQGTLIVAHPQDKGELQRLLSTLSYKLPADAHHVLRALNRQELEDFIPGFSPVLQEGYWVRDEGHINTHEFYHASRATIQAKGIHWHEKIVVRELLPYQIITPTETHSFDWVFDCRGLGARSEWPMLRGVRGEVLILEAPEVRLSCPVRIMHPRYPIYISPRANHQFVVGATSLESDDLSPISAQSMLELLSACYTVHPGFAEARIMQSLTQCRPALPDHQPRLKLQNGLISINGLYRHGYMIGPTVVEEAMCYVEGGLQAMHYPELLDVEETLLCN